MLLRVTFPAGSGSRSRSCGVRSHGPQKRAPQGVRRLQLRGVPQPLSSALSFDRSLVHFPTGFLWLTPGVFRTLMSNGADVVLRKLPVPTGDELMVAVGSGQAACDTCSRLFLSWPVQQAVPQLVMNAIDPLLLELIVGAEHAGPLVSGLRAHYVQVRGRYPGPFADVEQVWAVQRAWWLQFVLDTDEAAASGSGMQGPSIDIDLLVPHAAAPLSLLVSRSAKALAPETVVPVAGRAESRSTMSVGPAAPRGQAPIPGQHGELPVSDVDSEPSERAPGKSAGSPAVAPPVPAGPRSVPLVVRPQASATPVRPRIPGAASVGVPPRVAAGGAASSRAVGGKARPSVAAASGVSGGVRSSAAQSPARAGRSSLGDSGRKLIEAAYLSHDEAWSLSQELLGSSPDFLDLSEWRLGTREYARLRERLFGRQSPRR